jgi:predicted dehydrogenase
MEFQMRNWWHFTWISGDHIVEQSVHSVDRLAWAMNDKLPSQVQCLGGRSARSGPEHGNVYDHFAAIYEYDDGRRAHHTARQMDGCPTDNTDYVYGTKGRAVVNGFGNLFKLYDYSGKEMWSYARPSGDMYQIEHNELFKSIRDGRPINDCPRAAYSVAMAIAGRMAAYTGQTVKWQRLMESQENLQPATLEWGAAPAAEVAIPGKTKLV